MEKRLGGVNCEGKVSGTLGGLLRPQSAVPTWLTDENARDLGTLRSADSLPPGLVSQPRTVFVPPGRWVPRGTW